jgi:hypothetical protein
MALTFTRTLVQPVTTQTINSAATYTSAEVDIGADAIAEQIWLYLEVDGFAAAPTGTMIVTIAPVHTTAGDAFSDGAVTHPFTVSADSQYQFAIPLSSLPRFFKVLVENDTDENTDASAVDCWIEYQVVTA